MGFLFFISDRARKPDSMKKLEERRKERVVLVQAFFEREREM